MLRKIRIALAAVMFTMITLLFLDVTGTLHKWLGWVARIQFLPALLALNTAVVVALIVITLVFGRIYCSVICPLGIMQDCISAVHGRRKKNRFGFSPARNILRHTLLAVFAASLVGGVSAVVSLLAPYSSYGRIAANLFRPICEAGNNILAVIAERMDSYAFYSVDVWIRSMPTFIVAAATFAIIAVLAWKHGRTYCNTICPVGTLLGFLSRFSWLKVRFDTGKCNSCGLCARNCKAAAIDTKNHTVDYSRCVACGDCLGKCSKGALKYSHGSPGGSGEDSRKETMEQNSRSSQNIPDSPKTPRTPQEPSPKETIDSGRRSFLLGSAIAVTAAAMAQEKKKVDGGLAEIEDKTIPERGTPITPPGSMSAQHMAQHCTACQLCVSACPNGVLRPSTSPDTFMQPTMSYERGYCRPECTRCGRVCPTGAIKPIGKEDKSALQIGHAVWIKKNCIPVTDGVPCGNCARHCPTGAIQLVPLTGDKDSGLMIPAVNEAACIGCGACENLCPARPFSAIYVEGHEVHREI